MTDLLDDVLGPRVAALRAARPEFVRYTQGSYDAMVAPPHPTGLTASERATAARRTAEQLAALDKSMHPVACAVRTANWRRWWCRSSMAACIAPAFTPAASPN